VTRTMTVNKFGKGSTHSPRTLEDGHGHDAGYLDQMKTCCHRLSGNFSAARCVEYLEPLGNTVLSGMGLGGDAEGAPELQTLKP